MNIAAPLPGPGTAPLLETREKWGTPNFGLVSEIYGAGELGHPAFPGRYKPFLDYSNRYLTLGRNQPTINLIGLSLPAGGDRHDRGRGSLSLQVWDATCGACGSPGILCSLLALWTTSRQRGRFKFRFQQFLFRLRRQFRRPQQRRFRDVPLIKLQQRIQQLFKQQFWRQSLLQLWKFQQFGRLLWKLALQLGRFFAITRRRWFRNASGV